MSALAIAATSVLVFPTKMVSAWPSSGATASGVLMPLSQMLTRHFSTDAHFAAYQDQAHPTYRLKNESLVGNATTTAAAPVMQLLVFDVDDEEAHREERPSAPEWWLAEKAKIERVRADVPGLFVYRTRGGYRLVGRTTTPFPITATSTVTWKKLYWSTLLSLYRGYGIVGDPACADWTRLYRVPGATRE